VFRFPGSLTPPIFFPPSPIPSDIAFPVIPRVPATGCLGSAFLSCSQSWFLQHQVRLCVWIAAQIHFGSIIFHFLFKLCLVFFPDAVGVSWLGKTCDGLHHGCSNLKPGSGRQFNLWIVAIVICFTLESAHSWLYAYGLCKCEQLIVL
jgi:hypothetical protein